MQGLWAGAPSLLAVTMGRMVAVPVAVACTVTLADSAAASSSPAADVTVYAAAAGGAGVAVVLVAVLAVWRRRKTRAVRLDAARNPSPIDAMTRVGRPDGATAGGLSLHHRNAAFASARVSYVNDTDMNGVVCESDPSHMAAGTAAVAGWGQYCDVQAHGDWDGQFYDFSVNAESAAMNVQHYFVPYSAAPARADAPYYDMAMQDYAVGYTSPAGSGKQTDHARTMFSAMMAQYDNAHSGEPKYVILH